MTEIRDSIDTHLDQLAKTADDIRKMTMSEDLAALTLAHTLVELDGLTQRLDALSDRLNGLSTFDVGGYQRPEF